MFGLGLLAYRVQMAHMKRQLDFEIDQRMQAGLSPTEYRQWRKERDAEEIAERRHRELISAIESTGRRY